MSANSTKYDSREELIRDIEAVGFSQFMLDGFQSNDIPDEGLPSDVQLHLAAQQMSKCWEDFLSYAEKFWLILVDVK